ncbi:hypothetical protein D9M68_658890 [compost metagenome]
MVLAQQHVQGAFAAQVYRARDITQIASIVCMDRMGNIDQQVAGQRDVGLADQRLAGLQRRAAAVVVDPGAHETPQALRGGKHRAVGADDRNRVETVGLLLQARGLGGQDVGNLEAGGQVPGAVFQLPLGRLQERAGALRELGRVDAIGFERVRDELFALDAIAGVERVGGGNDGAEYGEREHEPAQVDSHEGTGSGQGKQGRILTWAGIRLIQQAGGPRLGGRPRAEVAHDGRHASVAGQGHRVAQRHVLPARLGHETRTQAVRRKVALQARQLAALLHDVAQGGGGQRFAHDIAAAHAAKQGALRDAAGAQPGIERLRRHADNGLLVVGAGCARLVGL